jgi:hypothetical protein
MISNNVKTFVLDDLDVDHPPPLLKRTLTSPSTTSEDDVDPEYNYKDQSTIMGP